MIEQYFIKITEDKKGIVKNVTIDFPVFEISKDGKFLVESPVLKAIGYSSISKEEAAKDLIDDIKLFFLYHIKNNSLKETLKGLGWQTKGYNSKKFSAPVIDINKYKTASTESISLKVA